MTLPALTPGDLMVAQLNVKIAQHAQDLVDERLAVTKEALDLPADDADAALDELAYITVTQALQGVVNGRLVELRETLGMTKTDADPKEQLAEVIELFDGQHRQRNK